MKASGIHKMMCLLEGASSYGPTAPDTMDFGPKVNRKATVVWSTLLVTSTQVCGKTTWLMAMDRTNTETGTSMKGCGRTICSMGRVLRYGLTVRCTRVNIKRVKNTARASLFGVIRAVLRGNSLKTICMDKVSILGVMGGCIVGNGNIRKCKDGGYFHGLMAESMLVIIRMI